MEKIGHQRALMPHTEPRQKRVNPSAFDQEGEIKSPMQRAANSSAQVSQMRSIQAAANAATRQLQKQSAVSAPAVQRKENKTGLPDELKSGIENLSGMAMDDVKVHYNSSEPAQMQAHAFAQGTDIHVAPGQEQHLAHEAWHVVQQKQGRVQATTQLKGVGINDDSALETEADVMGAKAMQMQAGDAVAPRMDSADPSRKGRGLKNTLAPRQLKGKAPYKKEITLQTKYTSLTAQNTTHNVSGDQVNEYAITNFYATNRPPAYLGGEKLKVQGQHKVAWCAIWGALQRCIGKKIDDAAYTMQEIVNQSGVTMYDDEPNVSVCLDYSSPQKLDDLIVKGHNYLVSKQVDNPAWLPQGTEEEKKSQLKGKGEKELGQLLYIWQNLDPDKRTDVDIVYFLNSTAIGKMFDTTGRDDIELADVQNRAKIELKIHNPALYAKFQTEIDTWVDK
jgi:Domain of unknown function (DUF4157)